VAVNLSAKQLAEGVEQEAQLAFLREHHCDGVQGYLLGRPMPPERVREVMAEPDALPAALAGEGEAASHRPRGRALDTALTAS
jgi:predicted signal transduction protein with EAL and GGDEF domain